MNVIKYNVNSGDVCQIGRQYEYGKTQVIFEGYQVNDSANEIYFKFVGRTDDSKYLIPIIDMTLDITQQLTKHVGQFSCQLEEMNTEGTLVSQSPVFYVAVKRSIKVGADYEVQDPRLETIYQKYNAMYNTINDTNNTVLANESQRQAEWITLKQEVADAVASIDGKLDWYKASTTDTLQARLNGFIGEAEGSIQTALETYETQTDSNINDKLTAYQSKTTSDINRMFDDSDRTSKEKIDALASELDQRRLAGEFNGENGYSPSAKVEPTTGGVEITITDKSGTTKEKVLNGKNGADGSDYVITDADKNEIADNVKASVNTEINELKSDLTDLKDVTVTNEQASENIIESLTWTSGYMSINGNVSSSSSLHYTNKILVKEGDILSSKNTFRFVTAFCGDTVIPAKGDSDGNNMSYTVPEGIDGVVITRYTSSTSDIIKTTTVHKNILEDRVETLEYSITNMGYMRTSGNLSNGQTLSLPYHNVKNHNVIVFSANITSFDSLKIGKQTNTFVTIDNTNVSVTCDSSSQNFSVAHGLTIQNNIQITIENETSTGLSRIRVLSCGNEFEATIPNNARFLMDNGSHYVTSINSTLTDCAFSWTSRHINKPIWLFGDSYFSWYPERWTYYLARDGFTDSCMLNGHAGQNSSSALLALTNLLKVRVPQMVVWCLGMNDEDGDTEVNSSWLDCYNNLVNLSNEYGFKLVLYTTPTTPTMNNRFKNAIVRNSGYRYVEADKSLRIDDDGNWIEGTLDDNVHPTIKGAKLLYHRFLADIPELTSKC